MRKRRKRNQKVANITDLSSNHAFNGIWNKVGEIVTGSNPLVSALDSDLSRANKKLFLVGISKHRMPS